MGKRKKRDDPIADYIEWTENRYNPGYYLGGNIPPYLRKTKLSAKSRRLSGALLGIEGLIGLVITLGAFATAWEFAALHAVLSLAVALLVCWAAIVMFRSARSSSHRVQSKKRGTE